MVGVKIEDLQCSCKTSDWDLYAGVRPEKIRNAATIREGRGLSCLGRKVEMVAWSVPNGTGEDVLGHRALVVGIPGVRAMEPKPEPHAD